MSDFLEEKADIWVGRPTIKSENYALQYALVSLPWTFDRMRYDSTQKSMNKRLTNIFHGVLNQSILLESLEKQGLEASLDWSKYRETDIFDFKIGEKVFDVKTVNVYEDYGTIYNRQKFSLDLLIQNKEYSGSEWQRFFPCLITISQITPSKTKDGYIFGIAVSNSDPNSTHPTEGDDGFWLSTPYGKSLPFFQDKFLIKRREEENSGFKPIITWIKKQDVLLNGSGTIKGTIYGEWKGSPISEKFTLELGSQYTCKSEFSSLTSMNIDRPYLLDQNSVSVSAINNLEIEVSKRTDPNVNLNELTEPWEVSSTSFTNLKVPERYEIYWLGFTSFEDFLRNFQRYPSYFCPLPSDPNHNQEARINDRIMKHFERIDRAIGKMPDQTSSSHWPKFEDFVSDKKIEAGLLLSAQRRSGQVLGAGSYYYPGSFSFHESALYILPADLWKLSKLKNWVYGRV